MTCKLLCKFAASWEHTSIILFQSIYNFSSVGKRSAPRLCITSIILGLVLKTIFYYTTVPVILSSIKCTHFKLITLYPSLLQLVEIS